MSHCEPYEYIFSIFTVVVRVKLLYSRCPRSLYPSVFHIGLSYHIYMSETMIHFLHEVRITFLGHFWVFLKVKEKRKLKFDYSYKDISLFPNEKDTTIWVVGIYINVVTDKIDTIEGKESNLETIGFTRFRSSEEGSVKFIVQFPYLRYLKSPPGFLL